MKTISYGIFGEDDAHRIFIRNFLNQMTTDNITFAPNDKFHNTVIEDSGDRKKVRSNLQKVAKIAYASYYISLLIIVIDNDFRADNGQQVEKEIKSILEPLIEKDHGKKFLTCIPIQCIEHWLWYLKDSNLNSLENKSNKEAKINVYGTERLDRIKKNLSIQKIMDNFSINDLRNSSQSFAKFYKSVEDFINERESEYEGK